MQVCQSSEGQHPRKGNPPRCARSSRIHFIPLTLIGGERIIMILLCENASGSWLCHHKCIEQIICLYKFADTAGWMQKPVPWISSSSKYVPPCGGFLTVYCRCEGLAIDFVIVMSCIKYYFCTLVSLGLRERDRPG